MIVALQCGESFQTVGREKLGSRISQYALLGWNDCQIYYTVAQTLGHTPRIIQHYHKIFCWLDDADWSSDFPLPLPTSVVHHAIPFLDCRAIQFIPCQALTITNFDQSSHTILIVFCCTFSAPNSEHRLQQNHYTMSSFFRSVCFLYVHISHHSRYCCSNALTFHCFFCVCRILQFSHIFIKCVLL